jgi:hypothetical protein
VIGATFFPPLWDAPPGALFPTEPRTSIITSLRLKCLGALTFQNCYNKVTQTRWLKQQKFRQFWRLNVWDEGVSEVVFFFLFFFFFIFILFLFYSMGVWIQSSHLLGRGCTAWATPPALLCD